MKTLLPGDQFILKLATFNPKSILMTKGLDYLEGQLPESLSQTVKDTRALPELTSEKLNQMLSNLMARREPQPPSGDTVDQLIQAMKEANPVLKEVDKKVKEYQPKSVSDFYLDDEVMPLGATFNLMPPSVQI